MARLGVAQVLVVAVGTLTAWVVATVVGPPLFNEHFRRARDAGDGQVVSHAEEAFRSATVITFSVALLGALAAALTVSVWTTRRIGRSVAIVATAAVTVAGGRYDTRVPPPGLGPEFDALADSFNQMAARLGSVETTRRRLLADLAHEMRTPVATLTAYLEGLEDGVRTLDAETAAVLRAQTERLGRLAQDMGAVSRAQEQPVAPVLGSVRVDRLVHGAVAADAPRYSARQVDLRADVPAGLPELHADVDRLHQVLANLLDNALRHTPAGGSVTVAARAAGHGVELTVTDTGDGIAAEHLPYLFERFYRVDTARDRDHGGSGIGLAISKALVESHGGHVSAASAGPGRGSVLTVWLPTGPDPAPATGPHR